MGDHEIGVMGIQDSGIGVNELNECVSRRGGGGYMCLYTEIDRYTDRYTEMGCTSHTAV